MTEALYKNHLKHIDALTTKARIIHNMLCISQLDAIKKDGPSSTTAAYLQQRIDRYTEELHSLSIRRFKLDERYIESMKHSPIDMLMADLSLCVDGTLDEKKIGGRLLPPT